MTALVIAAGYSSRAGGFKPLLPLGEMSVIERTLSAFSTTCTRFVVVGGHNFKLLKGHLKGCNLLKQMEIPLTLVYNEDYPGGMFTSVKKGAASLGDGPFFFTPADIPGVRTETVERLAAAEGDVVLPAYGKRSGHPVKLSGRVKEAILAAGEQETLRDVLNRFEKIYLPVDDQAVLMDMDTPEDYKKMADYLGERV